MNLRNSIINLKLPIKTTGSSIKIPVNAPGSPPRTLDATELLRGDEIRKTVVLFHGNGMISADNWKTAEKYYKEGWNVLMVTIGGYPGSNMGNKDTDEASCYQDIEAIKKHLWERGVREIGYHGISLGGAFAIHAAATDKTNYKGFDTKFVVANQTFTNVGQVAKRLVGNIPIIGYWINRTVQHLMAEAFRSKRVCIGCDDDGQLIYEETNGFNSIEKVKKLAKDNIPLLAIGANRDFMMGILKIPCLVKSKKGRRKLKLKIPSEKYSFSFDLIKAYFKAKRKNNQSTLTLKKHLEKYHDIVEGGHCTDFHTGRGTPWTNFMKEVNGKHELASSQTAFLQMVSSV